MILAKFSFFTLTHPIYDFLCSLLRQTSGSNEYEDILKGDLNN